MLKDEFLSFQLSPVVGAVEGGVFDYTTRRPWGREGATRGRLRLVPGQAGLDLLPGLAAGRGSCTGRAGRRR